MGKINSKPQLGKYSINLYDTEGDLAGYNEELSEELNPYFKGFSTPKKARKSDATEIRIVGAILKMLKAALIHGEAVGCRVRFTKQDLARMVHNDGSPVSERTIQRYLKTVLAKMASVYDLHYEIINGRHGGIMLWTDTLNQLEESGKRLFDEKLVTKSRRKNDRKRAEWVAMKGRQKKAPVFKAKGSIKTKLPAAMMRLASRVLKKATIEPMNRFSPSELMLKGLLAKVLALGHDKEKALEAILRAVRVTDTAMSDFHVENPFKYCFGVAVRTLEEPLGIKAIREKCSEFWNAQMSDYLSTYKEMVSSGIEVSEEAHKATLSYFRAKLNIV